MAWYTQPELMEEMMEFVADFTIEALRPILDEIAPDYIPTLLKQADALLKMNRDEEAAVAYGAVLKREARNPWALVGLARIDMDAGRFEDARGRLEAAVEESNWGIGYDLLPTVYERLGMNERVAEIRGRAKAFGTFSDTPDPWMLELYDDCYDVYRLMLAGGDANFVGDLPRAVRIIERALSLAPDNATVHFQLAGLYLAANRRVDARRQFEQCLAANPEQPDAWFQLSRVLADLGDARGSDRTLDAGLSRCPGSPGLHMEHGRRLAAAGRSEEAISEYKETIRLRPQEAGGYVDLAGLYFKLGRLDEGVAQLMRSLEMEPENPVALSAAALYSVTTGDEATAAEWIRRVRLQPRISAKERTNIEAAFVQRFGRPPQ